MPLDGSSDVWISLTNRRNIARLSNEVWFHDCRIDFAHLAGCSSHFLHVRCCFHLFSIGALLIPSAWGISFDHSSLSRELIDICCYLRGFNASVACLVFILIDFSRTVVVNVWALSGPFSPSCLILVLFSVTNFSYQFQLPMFRCNVQSECSMLHSCGECSVLPRFLARYDPACP